VVVVVVVVVVHWVPSGWTTGAPEPFTGWGQKHDARNDHNSVVYLLLFVWILTI
jgi:hypothetical protein